MSREVVTFASLGAVLLVLSYQSQAIMQHLLSDMVAFLARAGEADILGSAQLRSAAFRVLSAVLPALVAAAAAGAPAVVLQTNFLLHLGSLQPKISRISPTAGLKRLFGSNGLVEVVKSIVGAVLDSHLDRDQRGLASVAAYAVAGPAWVAVCDYPAGVSPFHRQRGYAIDSGGRRPDVGALPPCPGPADEQAGHP